MKIFKPIYCEKCKKVISMSYLEIEEECYCLECSGKIRSEIKCKE